MEIALGDRHQNECGIGVRVCDGEHVVATVDRDDTASDAQQATGKYTAELAKADDDDVHSRPFECMYSS